MGFRPASTKSAFPCPPGDYQLAWDHLDGLADDEEGTHADEDHAEAVLFLLPPAVGPAAAARSRPRPRRQRLMRRKAQRTEMESATPRGIRVGRPMNMNEIRRVGEVALWNASEIRYLYLNWQNSSYYCLFTVGDP